MRLGFQNYQLYLSLQLQIAVSTAVFIGLLLVRIYAGTGWPAAALAIAAWTAAVVLWVGYFLFYSTIHVGRNPIITVAALFLFFPTQMLVIATLATYWFAYWWAGTGSPFFALLVLFAIAADAVVRMLGINVALV